jgi:hypothetical protein
VRAFIDGKIANMRTGLLRAGRRVPDPAMTSAAETLAITRLMLTDATSYDELPKRRSVSGDNACADAPASSSVSSR